MTAKRKDRINSMLAAALLAIALPANTPAQECRTGCAARSPGYSSDAYADDCAMPHPDEAPLDFFGRRFFRVDGDISNYSSGYRLYPDDEFNWATAPSSLRDSSLMTNSPDIFTSFNNAEPSELSQSYTEDYADLSETGQCGPTSRKPGMFQKWAWRATNMQRSDNADMGELDLETWVVFGLPCPTRDNPLLITPGFAARPLDGPGAPDLPGTLYDAYVQFRWLGKINDCWGYDLVFTPGIYSDLETDSDDAWRFTGRAILSYDWSPTTQLVFGVVYLDREDVSAVPAAGIIYQPCDGVRWELIAPRPRYARRWHIDCEQEKWWYLAGEFGGGSWAIERANKTDDIVTLSDYRLLLGFETKLNGGAGRLIEFGYVFGREIEYASATPTVELDSSFLVRAGVTF